MKRALLSLMALMLAAALLLCLVLGWMLGLELPRQARNAFGPPADNLSLRQQIWLSYRLMTHRDLLRTPGQVGGQPVPFSIQPGESPRAITNRLQAQGLISSADVLVDYLVYSGMDTYLQAGDFQLNPGMSAVEIAAALQDSTPGEVAFRILPGWRIEEIADALPTSGLSITPAAFLQSAYAPPPALAQALGLPAGASLEGYLFPDRYRLARSLPLDDLIATLTTDFQTQVDFEMHRGFQQQGLSLHEAVTLASLVQREAMLTEEMPTIASVFINRLRDGMRLGADPTVQYALGKSLAGGWWKAPLSLNDLQVSSPYNTYQIEGLPPGPICNPGLQALRAVAYPEQTGYYYFRAACDGSGRHSFAYNFEEHKQNACP